MGSHLSNLEVIFYNLGNAMLMIQNMNKALARGFKETIDVVKTQYVRT